MVAPVIMMPVILFGGFFANAASYPGWVKWIQYLSPVRYGCEALVRNEWEGDKPPALDMISILNYNIGKWNCIYVLIGFTIFFRILALIFLKLLIQKFQ